MSKKTFLWIEDRTDKSGFIFWKTLMAQLFPEVIVESKKNNSELVKAVKAVKALINTDPKASWTFVCDGLNTHRSESLVRYVAEACSMDLELGEKGKKGILKDMKSRSKFLHDPSRRIRFVYTPKHSSWMNQIEIWFGIINRKLLKRKSCLSIEELEQSIQRFIEQYNLTAHPFKWTYAGIPLAI